MRNLIIALLLFFSNFIQAITGFAGTLLAMPGMIRLTDAPTAKLVLNMIAQISGLMIAFPAHEYVNRKELMKMFLGVTAGMTLGILLSGVVPSAILIMVYGIFVIAVSAVRLIGKEMQTKTALEDAAAIFAAGVAQGLFVSGGPLIVLYSSGKMKDKESIRATIAALWVITGFYYDFAAAFQGQYTAEIWKYTGLGILPVLFGTVCGTKILAHVSQKAFSTLTYGLLILSGVMLLV